MNPRRASQVAVSILLAGAVASGCGSSSKSDNFAGHGAGADAGMFPASGGAGGDVGGAAQGGGGGGQQGSGAAQGGGGLIGSGGATATGGGAAGLDASKGGPDANGGTTLDGSAGGGADGSTSASCATSRDCVASSGKPICDAVSGTCVACHANLDCSLTEQCTNNTCVALKACTNSIDCSGSTTGKTICDRGPGVCVACVSNSDCPAGQNCVGRACSKACASDNQCTTLTPPLLCDTAAGVCAECVRTTDCPANQYCAAGKCVDDTCVAGAQSCVGNTVYQCNTTGSAVAPLAVCTGGAACVESGATASCKAAAAGPDAAPPPPADAGLPLPAHCTNRARDATETDVDCGGPDCAACPNNDRCNTGADCTSQVCTSVCLNPPFCIPQNRCQAPTCTDNVQNGNETDVDCGGGGVRACPACGGSASCKANSDCMSNVCTKGACTVPACAPAGCPAGPCFPFGRCCTTQGACGCSGPLGGCQ